jgi:hypothetical protein
MCTALLRILPEPVYGVILWRQHFAFFPPKIFQYFNCTYLYSYIRTSYLLCRVFSFCIFQRFVQIHILPLNLDLCQDIASLIIIHSWCQYLDSECKTAHDCMNRTERVKQLVHIWHAWQWDSWAQNIRDRVVGTRWIGHHSSDKSAVAGQPG